MPQPVSAEEELYWLALKMVPGLGTKRSNQVLETFRSPEAIFRASRSELEGSGLPRGLGNFRGCRGRDTSS